MTTTQNPAQDVSDAAIGAAFRLTDSINRDADKFVDDVLTRAKGIDANNTKTTKRPSVESLWQAFWATPHDERKWNRPTGTNGKPMPMTLVSFKYEVVRAAFELDAARELQQAQDEAGTFNFPICGRGTPHQHTSEEVARHRGAIDRGDPISLEAYGQAFSDAVRGEIDFRFSGQMIGAIRARAVEIQCRINRSQPARELQHHPSHTTPQSSAPAVGGMSASVRAALYDVKSLCGFAYEQGYHEMGYDPVAVVESALTGRW
jgi:hypothetical protein